VAFEEALAGRIRDHLGGTAGLAEKRMFGGIAFLLNGNMCCGVHGDEVILRVDPEAAEDAVRKPHVRIFDLTGRPMRGWLLVGSDAVSSDEQLRAWIDMGVDFAGSLPAK
jgi:TfoX/Sxy family transcriptional regulator of competence genes